MALQTKKFVLPKDRASIWNDSAGGKELGTYHPEYDNYVVASVDRGEHELYNSIHASVYSISIGGTPLIGLHTNFNGQLLGLAVLSDEKTQPGTRLH